MSEPENNDTPELITTNEPVAGETKPKAAKLPLIISLLSLLLAISLILGSVTAAYYWLWPYYQQQQQIQKSEFERLTRQLSQALETSQRQNRDLQRQAQSQDQSISLLSAQLQELESGLRQLRQLNQSPPEQWVISEADYLIRIAGQKLWVESDVQTSTTLLINADKRIASLHDPRLIPIRRALAQDIQTLKALPRLDINSIALTLDALIQQVHLWPVKNLEIPKAIDSQKRKEITENPADWQQNLLSIWESFIDGFIKVEQRVSDVAPLLSPEQRWFLIQNVRLKLQQAQLAALRAQPELYRGALQQANQWLKTYFITENQAVKQARQKLTELEIRPIQQQLPKALVSSAVLSEQLEQTTREENE